jgi:hypothetical protein
MRDGILPALDYRWTGLQKALIVPSRKRCAGTEKKLNISATPRMPPTAFRAPDAAVIDGTTLPDKKIARAARIVLRDARRRHVEFCELA